MATTIKASDISSYISDATLTRDAYVAAMHAANLDPETDDDLTGKWDYALTYGQYPSADVERRMWQRLGRDRRDAILAATAAAAPQRAQPTMVRADCGHRVSPVMRMSASTGSSCPDCYDRMSE